MAENETEKLESEGAIILDQARAIRIGNLTEFDSAVDFLQAIKAQSKRVAAFFAPMKKAASEAHKAIVAREKAILSPLGEAEAVLKKEIAPWQRMKEDQSAQAKAQAEKANMEAVEEALALAAETGLSAKDALEIMGGLPSESKPVADGKTKGISIRKQLRIEITDPDAVPREYCIPDMKKIREAGEAGVAEIPGVSLVWDDAVSVRA